MTAFVGFPQSGHSFSANEVGQALSGLIARDVAGVPRVGMLAAPAVKAVASSWKTQVDRFVYVHQIDGAVQLSGLSAAEQVDILPAVGNIPAGQARIDLVCWEQVTAELVVLRGIPAVAPVAPSPGLLAPVAQVRVNATDGMVIQGQIAPRFVKTRLVEAGERRTVPVVLDGAAGWNGVASWRNFKEVKFVTPFDAVPSLIVTGVFGAEAVQDLDVTQVTRTGFKGRVKRFGHSIPIAGTLTYVATEQ